MMITVTTMIIKLYFIWRGAATLGMPVREIVSFSMLNLKYLWDINKGEGKIVIGWKSQIQGDQQGSIFR